MANSMCMYIIIVIARKIQGQAISSLIDHYYTKHPCRAAFNKLISCFVSYSSPLTYGTCQKKVAKHTRTVREGS